jgi:hypothetical protein
MSEQCVELGAVVSGLGLGVLYGRYGCFDVLAYCIEYMLVSIVITLSDAYAIYIRFETVQVYVHIAVVSIEVRIAD